MLVVEEAVEVEEVEVVVEVVEAVEEGEQAFLALIQGGIGLTLDSTVGHTERATILENSARIVTLVTKLRQHSITG